MDNRRRRAAAAGVVVVLLPVIGGCAVPITGTAVRAPVGTTSGVTAPAGDVAGTVSVEANVRAGPGMGYAIVASLPLNTGVTISCFSGEWMRLATPNAGGFVYNTLLRLQGTPRTC